MREEPIAAIVAAGFASIFVRGSLKPAERGSRYDVGSRDPIAAALRAAEMPTPDPGPDFVEDMIDERQAGVTQAIETGDADAAPPAPPAPPPRRRSDD